MGLLFGGRSERREGRPLQEAIADLLNQGMWGGRPGGYAEPALGKMETSLQVVAVRSAVDMIASLVSELPIEVYSGDGAEAVRRKTPPRLKDPSGDGQGVEDWGYQVITSWLLRGNVYADILDKTDSGMLLQVLLHHPDSVGVYLDEGRPRWSVAGKTVTDNSRFLHRRVNPLPGTLLGLSPIAAHADSLGISISSVRFGRDFFQSGAHPSGILNNEQVDLGKSQADTAKERFKAALFNRREPVVLGRGWKWQQIQINPEESQFLETQGFSEAQCARIFGPGIAEVLGYGQSGSSITYSNMVDRDLAILKYSINRWCRRYERLLSMFLPASEYVKLNRDALLEMNVIDRFRKHEISLKNKIETVNEVRAIEKLAPVEWGNEPNETSAPAPPADPGDEGDDDED